MARSEAQMIRDNEARRAAAMRGSCDNCGHEWRPRNPSRGVNRCPGCGIRGNVKYHVYDNAPS